MSMSGQDENAEDKELTVVKFGIGASVRGVKLNTFFDGSFSWEYASIPDDRDFNIFVWDYRP